MKRIQAFKARAAESMGKEANKAVEGFPEGIKIKQSVRPAWSKENPPLGVG